MRDVEIPNWLKGLPLAPEFRPTDTEFADPIAYISKIEKEAGAFGICKVIPPLPKPSRKYVLYNLNKSLSKCPELVLDANVGSKTDDGCVGDGGEARAVFTTRHQELGQSEKRVKGKVESQLIGAQKQVWQSGEVYTLEQFEAKSKIFARSQLAMVKEVSPLVIETMFWKAASEKPIYVEYANDVPGTGFGEPEGLFRYFHRRRRRRRKRGTFDRNNRESSGGKNELVDNSNSIMYSNSVDKDSEIANLHAKDSSCTSTCFPSDQSANFSTKKSSNAGKEMEGTAGWKLSNSPWNLQVIARSPGSLTRFMPDDIPGVTSPMIYIGMLFSWFAWHVEDHELHSLNYLHMGSPKTWYAVPGDYAFTFEEVIRLHAYGGNADRLDALTLLGEKTTLLSPEVIVTSGIPCCRLVQYPGEFVVTFPRAYHVGFSHGFNCGEAANFGTSKWLTVAKEAAVRRAAMNYLPMLSHQQLLYLLTMSFISRVPRSLLPGARSSRLRNRQKEERELSVKTAFIEDILKENYLLTILLQKDSSYHVVMWDLDKLPSSSSKESQLCSNVDTIAPISREKNDSDNSNNQDLYTEMSMYMDNVNEFYADFADDLLYDYQVDSGTLPCVACGILGFPFMAVVQPSEQAARDLLAEDPDMIQQLASTKSAESLSLGLTGRTEGSSADDRKPNESFHHEQAEASLSVELSQSAYCPRRDHHQVITQSSSPQHVMVSSAVRTEKKWNLSDGYSRPQIFCLEHAIQTVDMLHSKGGAHVLGICHSDFQKIKAHAAVVAEEICIPFSYNEIPLDNASQEDLNLIDYATDDQGKDESAQDWTSKLGISLEHCVKMRKNFPSHKVHHAMRLGGLFSNTIISSNALKWQSRRPRSKRHSNPPTLSKTSVSKIETVEEPGAKCDVGMARKEDKVIIQYYRKKYIFKASGVIGVGNPSADSNQLPPEELPIADCVDPNMKIRNVSDTTPSAVEDAGNVHSGTISSPSISTMRLQHEDPVTLSSGNLNKNPCPSQGVESLISISITASVAETVNAETGNCAPYTLVEINEKCVSTCHDSQELPKVKVSVESTCNQDRVDSENSAGLQDISVHSPENGRVARENKITGEIDHENMLPDHVQTDEYEKQNNIQAAGDDVMEEASEPVNSCSDADDSSEERSKKHMETTIVNEHGITGQLLDCSTLTSKGQQEIQNMSADGEERSVSSNTPPAKKVPGEMHNHEQLESGDEILSLAKNTELDGTICSKVQFQPTAKGSSKRKREVDIQNEEKNSFGDFTRSPCEGLRPRARKDAPENLSDGKKPIEDSLAARKLSKGSVSVPRYKKKEQQKRACHRCDVEGCRMSFQTKAELNLHMHNRCPVDGCRKKFSSHKYAINHQRVHDDDRPLKCPWKGCTMTFKWAWARTEHLRVHTGERPYKCKVEGCGLTFRFVSDFSRHRRKTGHYVN